MNRSTAIKARPASEARLRAELTAQLAAISRLHAVVELDMSARILSVNDKFLEIVGYDARELLGQPYEILIDPARRDAYAAVWRSVAGGDDVTDEHEVCARDETKIWLQASFNPVLGPDRQPFKVVMYASDVTAAKLQSVDYAGQIAAISKSQAVIEFDLTGAVLAANSRFLNAFGYRREEVVGRHHSMFVDAQTRASAEYAEFWEGLRRGEYKSGEYKRIGKGQREVWIQATYNPILDLSGRPLKVVKYAADVTAAKLRQADVAGQIAAIAKSQAVIEFDLDGYVLNANENFLRVTGYTLADIRGRHHRMFVDPAHVRLKEYEDFWSALRQGEYRSGEYRRIRKDGGRVWFQASYNPIKDLNGRPFKVVKYAADITEAVDRKEAEATLQAARSSAEAAAAAKTDFLANMSHELRTPLTSILGFSRLIGAHGGLTDDDQQHVELIRTAGETLLAVVNDILDFSKLEAGSTQLSPTPFSIRALAESVEALMRQQADDKGLTLTVDVPDDAVLLADAARLRQILLNLVSNAVKFTEVGGVEIATHISATPQGEALLEMRVTDTGIGIPPDQQPLVFNRFSQVDASITRRFGGTGLGLAISRQLIELMGGEIGMTSDGQTGSTFWFRVALPFTEAAAGPEGHTAAPTLQRPLRVLMADDHAANRALVSALLEPFPIDLELVEDGAQAVEAASERVFDLILMDMQMPVMDGLTATRAIRALKGPRRDTPVLALTANILPSHVERCREAGMQGHIAKPIDLNALLEAISAHAMPATPSARPAPSRSFKGRQAAGKAKRAYRD